MLSTDPEGIRTFQLENVALRQQIGTQHHWAWKPMLSFAKNASADILLSGNAFISMMQTADLPDLDDPSRSVQVLDRTI
jgi:hypothetical protein